MCEAQTDLPQRRLGLSSGAPRATHGATGMRRFCVRSDPSGLLQVHPRPLEFAKRRLLVVWPLRSKKGFAGSAVGIRVPTLGSGEALLRGQGRRDE